MNERSSILRRDVLKMAFWGSLGTLTASASKDIYSATNLSYDERVGNDASAQIKELLRSRPLPRLPIKEEGKEYFVGVEINKEAFASALIFAFNTNVSSASLNQLLAHMEKRHADLILSNLTHSRKNSHYTPFPIWGGPDMTFFANYLQEYYLYQRKETSVSSLTNQLLLDRYVFHEIGHLMQNVEDPLGFATYFEDLVDPENDPLEIDAWNRATIIVERQHQNYNTHPNSQWPFGHFFIFS